MEKQAQCGHSVSQVFPLPAPTDVPAVPRWVRLLVSVAVCLAPLIASDRASAQNWWDHPYWANAGSIAVSGRPVPELDWIDPLVRTFMAERSIPAGLVGIAVDGEVVYLKGYGHDYNKQPLPENAPIRQASISKPMTAAAIQHLVAQGEIRMDDFAFDRGQQRQVGDFWITVGGILPWVKYNPFGTSAEHIEKITVEHLLIHRSGLSGAYSFSDLAFADLQCAQEMGVASPPGRVNMLRWVQSKRLDYEPDQYNWYSNIGYLVLGEIIETVSGLTVEQYVKTHLLTPNRWVPTTEVYGARSFREWQNPREPYYKTVDPKLHHLSYATEPHMVDNVWDNYGSATVERAYGGHHYEDSVSFGGFVATAPAILTFASHYQVRGDDVAIPGRSNPNLGAPIGEELVAGGFGGSLPGHETVVHQEDLENVGRIAVFVAFTFRTSRRWEFFDGHWPSDMLWQFLPELRAHPAANWPTTTSDGFWTALNTAGEVGVGGFNVPFRNFQQMLDRTTAGSKIRLFPGSQNWTGVLSTPMLIDAPLGAAVIGE